MKKYNIKYSISGSVIVRKADTVPNADEVAKCIEMMLAPIDEMKADITVSNLEAEEVEADQKEKPPRRRQIQNKIEYKKG